MADANLLDVLSKIGKKNALENVIVFGRVRCAIKEPKVYEGLEVVGGVYAIIDAYAFKCLGEDYFRSDVSDVNRVYFTKGSMVIVIDSMKWVGKDVKVFGPSFRRGCKIKKQWNSGSRDGIGALQFSRVGDGFKVVPNKILELGERDPDAKGTALEDFMVGVVRDAVGITKYPISLDSIAEYSGVTDYVELKEEDVDIPKSVFVDDGNRVDVSKINLHLTYHMNGKEKSPFYSDFAEEIEVMSERRKNTTDSMLQGIKLLWSQESDGELDYSQYGAKKDPMNIGDIAQDIKGRFVSRVASRHTEMIGESKLRGGYYTTILLDEAESGNLCPLGDSDTRRSVKEAVESIASSVQVDSRVLITDVDGIEMLSNPMYFAVGVVGATCGVDLESLAFNMNWCNRYFSVSPDMWFYMLIRYPYVLGMIGPGLGIKDCDVIYLSYSRMYNGSFLAEQNLNARKDLLFLENLHNASDKDSLVGKKVLASLNKGCGKLVEKYLNSYKFSAKLDIVEVLRIMFGDGILLSDSSVKDWEGMKWYSEDRLNNLIDRGMVDTVDNDVTLESDLEKEYLIYKVLVDKGNQLTGLEDDVIDSVIVDFEKEAGFKLEKLQKDGVHLTKYRAAVLSGCAGSGKTTTSDCMTAALKRLKDFDKKYQIIYCTPTGKACRRLAEVVKSTVRTINSQFGVGIGGSSYLAPVYMKAKNNPNEKIKIYIMDEMAMCNMSLLYEICRNLAEHDIIYFLGDIKQLPPIGKGNPFALLMKLLPCVELGVSKRAAEGSDINYNTTLVNCLSDGVVKELSYNDKDFMKVECADAVIPMEVTKAWSKFMNGTMNGTKYEEDDIQVITGYQKEEIIFSAPRLNKPLQQLLRKNDMKLFVNGDREFYTNDRVIHLRLNNYSMNRYVEVEKGVYQSVVTFGIVNGEVGKLVGVARSDMMNIIDFSDDQCTPGEGIYENVDDDTMRDLIKKRMDRGDTFREDSRTRKNNIYFIRVDVYDVELGRDVCVLYQAKGRMVGVGEIALEGSDVGCIDLAYALSTHKMQGSQSRVVICPFGTECRPTFINRNMMNTMFTRARDCVCCVGSVTGSESPINRGRQFKSKEDCNDTLSVLVNS